MDTETRRGLDETRRLLYTLDVCLERDGEGGTELVGTITNALRHHHPKVVVGDLILTMRSSVATYIERITLLLGD